MSEVIIHVKFIDIQTGKVFAQTDSPLSTLPQSFEAATHLQISDNEWDVVSADPMTAEQFSRTHELVLTLRQAKVSQIDVNKILYSLPTICDVIPALAPGTTKLNKKVFELHEDNWRQIEFIATKYKSDIQAEFSDILQIYEKSQVAHGFSAMHIRKRIGTALSIPFPALSSSFPHMRHYEGIGYERTAGLIAGGFGLETENFILFGEQHRNVISNLCIAFARQNGDKNVTIRQLQPFMKKYNLMLVDWCRCAAFDVTTIDGFWTT